MTHPNHDDGVLPLEPRAESSAAPVRPRIPDAPPAMVDGISPSRDASHTSTAQKPCPACGRRYTAAVGICSACGYDERRGITSSSKVDSRVNRVSGKSGGVVCRKCGYDLRGVRGDNCPECGAPSRERVERDMLAFFSARTTREAYLMPLIVLAIGVAAMLGLGFMLGSADAVGRVFAQAGVYLGVAAVCYLALGAASFGFDQPFHLVGLNLMAIVAASFGAVTLASLLGFGGLWLPVVCVTYLGLLIAMLDLDPIDALLMGIGTIGGGATLYRFLSTGSVW